RGSCAHEAVLQELRRGDRCGQQLLHLVRTTGGLMTVATFCGSCGTEIQPGVTFCGTCGAPVALSTTADAPGGVPPEPKSQGRRSPWLLAAVGIAVVAVGGVAAVLLTRGGGEAQPASQTVVRTVPAAATRTALAAPTT